MKTSNICWIVYDGTGATRPHSCKKDWFDAGPRQKKHLERYYLLHRAGEKDVENQAYSLKPAFRWSDDGTERFIGWTWEGYWADYSEDPITYPLSTGDAWAEWPSVSTEKG